MLSRNHNVKNKIAINTICWKKIYNAQFSSAFEYIQQLHMLSHVKYKNSIFKGIEKVPNIM